MAFVPNEIRDLIIKYSDEPTLATWACVSCTCWSLACAVLWRNLLTAIPLLALLDQHERLRKVHKRDRPAPSEDGYHEQQFTRWMTYASFVRKLTIDMTFITSGERSFLVEKAAGNELLPGLEVLKISEASDRDPGWGQSEHLTNLEDVEDLTLLLIAKSLKILAISYRRDRFDINFSVLLSRCPALRDIRLGHHLLRDGHYMRHTPEDPTKAEEGVGYMRRRSSLNPIDAMLNWKSLSHLTIFVHTFPGVHLANLCKLPVLERLTIVGPFDRQRDPQLSEWLLPQGTFRMLHQLVILRCPPTVVKEIFSCKFLLERLRSLCWDEGGWSGFEVEWGEGVQRLARHAAVLETLHIYSPEVE